MRDKQPCAPYAGLRDQLARPRRRASARTPAAWQALVVFTEHAGVGGAPRPAAAGARAAPAPPRDLKAYRALVRGVLALADEVGAELRYFSPWNEPNHPYFLSPQRDACDAGARSRAIAPTPRSRATCAPSWATPTRSGSCSARRPASSSRPRRATVGAGDDPRPTREGSCARAPVWSQHAYIGGTDPVAAVKAALASHRLPAAPRDLDHGDRRRACARRPLARARDHQRTAGLPAPPPTPARAGTETRR